MAPASYSRPELFCDEVLGEVVHTRDILHIDMVLGVDTIAADDGRLCICLRIQMQVRDGGGPVPLGVAMQEAVRARNREFLVFRNLSSGRASLPQRPPLLERGVLRFSLPMKWWRQGKGFLVETS